MTKLKCFITFITLTVCSSLPLFFSFMMEHTSLFIQLGENVSKSGGVVDPFDDAALLVERNHSVGTDM